MGPKVTIITAVYNGDPYLNETINSVLSQSVSDWEWIIVDDGSEDRTSEILLELADRRIQVIHQMNAGVSSARNAALEQAKGEYLTFLDADDALPRHSLECRIHFLDHNSDVGILDGAMSYRDVSLRNELKRFTPADSRVPLFQPLSRLDERYFALPFYMFRRELLGDVRQRVDMHHCEDVAFFLEICEATGAVYGAVEDVVYYYRTGHASAMSSISGLEDGYMKLLDVMSASSMMASSDLRYSRRRVARILLLSWLQKGRPIRALRASVSAFIH